MEVAVTRPYDDDRVRAGMERQLTTRSELLDGGATRLGWKAGFGSAEALSGFGTAGPLVGFLTDRTLFEDGSTISIDGWRNPRIEHEMFVRFGRNLTGGADPDEVRAAIDALGPAFEIVDIHPPPEDVEEILASNIFHRGVILGEEDSGRSGADIEGLTAEISVDGAVHTTPDDLETATGPILGTVAWVADTLADAGLSIRRGDVLITGSVIPPVPVASGSEVRYRLAPFPELTVRFS
jgi:2-oxopent-4-enoate/cis-2-oxohex-4-enoate hydratase